MQVKRRLNEFFGNILRKEKTSQSGEEEISTSRPKKKSNKKSNQSYSQWDLMEHVDVDTGSSTKGRNENTIYSDGLALDSLEVREEVDENNFVMSELQFENDNNKRKSFLKRNASFFRRSKRKKGKKDEVLNQSNTSVDPGSLTNIVQQINETLIEVAKFGTEETDVNEVPSPEPFAFEAAVIPSESTAWSVESRTDAVDENDFWKEEQHLEEHSQEIKKAGFGTGLRRQASKLASKFQRKPGSMRLKTGVSTANFPNTNLSRHRSASWSASNTFIDNNDVIEDMHGTHKRTQSFRRKMSFKKTRKAVVKSVASFGMSMAAASAVMPVAYECPPASFYPDYDANSPTELEEYYYRTISYQERDSIDPNGRHGQYTRPTSFYQHGYCYNG